jgi:uncharacterized protein (TIGR02444 family)
VTASGDPAVPADVVDLWRFSSSVYAFADVETACLTLQDVHGVDVPLVLWSVWAGFVVGELAEATISEAVASVEPWRQNVVEPLRAIRRWLKCADTRDPLARPLGQTHDTFADLRERIMAAELDAERRQLEALERIARPAGAEVGTSPTGPPLGLTAAIVNLEQVVVAHGVQPAAVASPLNVLRTALQQV